ncbi:MAG TPA: ABC transporter substrate-binding protein, partial [Burkholderiaceae bacterium]|nr:ABC transporter substrate-binding protein [Burkholderiaceae bacterium]
PVHTIFIREMRDAAARVNALRSRQVDIAAIDPDQADVLRKLNFGIVTTNIVMRMVGVWDAHGTEVAALREPKVRQAIRMAINREAILKALFANYGTAGLNFYPTGVPGHSDRLDDLRAHDVEAAKELMAEAGYRSGFEVNTVVLAHHARVAEVLAGELAKIGVRLEITVMPDAGSYFAAVRQKKAPLGIFAHQTALPLGMYHSLMSPSGRYNPFNIVDDKLDALAQEAARAEPQEAQQLYANLFYLMVGEQALVFPVVNMEILAALAPGIHFPEPTYTDAGLPNPRYLSFSPDADLPRF